MKSNILLISICILISACSKKNSTESSLVFANNMEGIHAWNENHPLNIIKTEKAHSGKFVCNVNSEFPYGSTFYMKLGDISSKKLKKLKVSCWLLSQDKAASPSLVFDILDKNKQSVEYLSKDCRGVIKSENAWFHISNEVNMEPSMRSNPENYLKVYVTNVVPQAVQVDDLIVEFSE